MTLTQITEKGIKDGEIINADINASAAIAGTKLSPNFGSQNIVTTGSITGNDLEIDSGTLSVDATNNRVGINTTSPNYSLHVNSGAANSNAIFESTDTAVELEFKDSTGTAFLECRNDFRLKNSAGEKLRIDSSGNVGINTTSPDSNFKLDVNGSLRLGDGNAGQRIQFSRSGLGDELVIGVDGTGSFSANDAVIQSSPSFGRPLIFGTSNAERMRLTSTGDFCVGTTTATGKAEIATSASEVGLTVTNDTHDSYLQILATAANKNSAIFFGDNGDGNIGAIDYDHNDNTLAFKVNGSERLHLQSNGDVYLNPTVGATAVTSGAIRRFSAGLDYWNGTAGSANAIKYAVHGAADDNMYGMGISGSLLELQSQVDIGFFAGSAGGGTGRRVEKARIRAGGGLTFNGDTAAANALDDYEEGTWSPSGFCDGGSLNIAGATYTKIGRVVYIYMYVSAMSIPNTSCEFKIYGLPFTVSNANDHYPGLTVGYSGAGNLPAEVRFLCRANTNLIYSHTTGGNSNTLNNQTMRAYLLNQALILTGFYFVD